MIETRRRVPRLALLVASLIVIGFCVCPAALAQERGIGMTEPYKAATIRVRSEFADGSAAYGFGLIVGERDGAHAGDRKRGARGQQEHAEQEVEHACEE